jgi:hypothetical protein
MHFFKPGIFAPAWLMHGHITRIIGTRVALPPRSIRL